MIGRDAMRRFDTDGTNPFAYVNVLLYTQQLEAAVAFLHWKGQHLAVRAFFFFSFRFVSFSFFSAQ